MSRAGRALSAALTAKAGGLCDVQVSSVPWRSATFAGERHAIAITVGDRGKLHRLLDGLGEHEFALPRCIVADIVAGPPGDDELCVSLEALTIDDV